MTPRSKEYGRTHESGCLSDRMFVATFNYCSCMSVVLKACQCILLGEAVSIFPSSSCLKVHPSCGGSSIGEYLKSCR